MLLIGFNYLIKKGITRVSVASALESRGFYEKTGAKLEDSNVYYDNLLETIEFLTGGKDRGVLEEEIEK